MSVAEQVTKLNNCRNDLADNLITMGVDTSREATLTELVPKVLDISSGGGGDLDAMIQRTITEIHSGATSIGSYAFSYCAALTTADLPLVTSIDEKAFYYCVALTTADLPLVTSIGNYAFQFCAALTTADFPLITSINRYTFYQCTALTTADLPLVTSIGIDAFYQCAALTTADFPLATSIGEKAFYQCAALTTADFPLATSIGEKAFSGCTKLSTLILRKKAVCTLANINAFTSTPIASGTGYVYVPASLVDTYKAATNWVTYTKQIRAIEDYPEITGG